MPNRNILIQVRKASKKAAELFQVLEQRQLIQPGLSEKELSLTVYELAFELFGIRKYWHKKIVRCGKNTLLPYRENPPELVLGENDIVFFDFGPIFESWEADIGRTYVTGNDPQMHKLKNDISLAWNEGKAFFDQHRNAITGTELYSFTCSLAKKYGWEYGNEHCGHLVGIFPHEKLLGENKINYIHPDNHFPMLDPDRLGNERYWIYEIHFVDHKKNIGGFFEQLLS